LSKFQVPSSDTTWKFWNGWNANKGGGEVGGGDWNG